MKTHAIILYLLVFTHFCKAQTGNYKWAFGFDNFSSVDVVKTNYNNDVFVSVFHQGAQIDADPTQYQVGLGSSNSQYNSIIKYDQNKNLLWSVTIDYPTGTGFNVSSMCLEKNNYVYVIGYYNGTIDLDPSPAVFNFTSNGSADIFIIKLNQTNGQLAWAKSIGGSGDDRGRDINVDDNGNVLIGASFNGTLDADPGAGTHSMSSNGLEDALFMQLDNSGNFNWAKSIGSPTFSESISKIIPYKSEVYLFGKFRDLVDFDPSTTSTFTLSNPQAGGFIAKYSNIGDFIRVKPIVTTSGGLAELYDASVNNNEVAICGTYGGALKVNPAIPSYTIASSGSREGYVAKYDTAFQFIWANSTRGTVWNANCNFYSVDTDSLQNVYIIGDYDRTIDIDPSAASYTLTNNGTDLEALVAKYSPTGQFLEGFKIGNINTQIAKDINVDKNLQYYVSGSSSYGAIDFDPSAVTNTLNVVGFFAKYGSSPSKIKTINATICQGQVYTLNNVNYSNSGSHKQIIYLPNGNDSIINLNLNLTTSGFNTNVLCQNSILVSQAPAGSTFQWINCSSQTPISGATSYSYMPNSSDDYAVKISYGGCIDTSNCENSFAGTNNQIPHFNWAHHYGNTGSSNGMWGNGKSITTDIENNLYVVGNFKNTLDVDLSSITKNIKASGTSLDIFITKYDKDGNLIWSIPMGTAGTSAVIETAESIVVDNQQNVYVTGNYLEAFNADPLATNYILQDLWTGQRNTYVAKYYSTGELAWIKGFGGTNEVIVNQLSIDKQGNLALVGQYSLGFDADPGVGTFSLTSPPSNPNHGYLIKLNNNGNFINAISLVSNYYTSDNETKSVTFDNSGNIIITGTFAGTIDFDPSISTFSLSTGISNSNTDIYYAKYSPTLQLIWAKKLGTTSNYDEAGYLEPAQNNSFYMSGRGGIVSVTQDFVAKFDSTGVLQNTYPSSNYISFVPKISTDKFYNLYIIGIKQFNASKDEVYVKKINSTTNTTSWNFDLPYNTSTPIAYYIGGIAVNKESDVYITGIHKDTLDFDPSATSIYTLAAQSGGQNFIAKYGQGCAPINTVSASGTGYLTSQVTNSYYEWKNCTTNQIVAATTTNTYYPTSPGQYKAIIHQGNCIDSTGCQNITTIVTSIKDIDNNQISIFPNPTQNIIKVHSPESSIKNIKIFDVSGRLVLENETTGNKNDIEVNVERLTSGIYTLKIQTEIELFAKKIIKQE